MLVTDRKFLDLADSPHFATGSRYNFVADDTVRTRVRQYGSSLPLARGVIFDDGRKEKFCFHIPVPILLKNLCFMKLVMFHNENQLECRTLCS